MTAIVDTDILIVGAGPAIAALASFLGQNGLSGLVISKSPHTAYTPRAHGFNPFALGRTGYRDMHKQLLTRSKSVYGTLIWNMRCFGSQSENPSFSHPVSQRA
ncbi:hypothetical protein LB503_009530 [Fusarium chuoi]|nr:hypothetical protein LB503_009530 [Fusarium chuoi]